MGDLPGSMVFRQYPMRYTRWSPNFTPLQTHQFKIDTHVGSQHIARSQLLGVPNPLSIWPDTGLHLPRDGLTRGVGSRPALFAVALVLEQLVGVHLMILPLFGQWG